MFDEGRWRIDRGEEEKEGGSEAGRRVRQGTKEGKEGGNEAGRRKRGSAPRYSISRGATARLCLTREK